MFKKISFLVLLGVVMAAGVHAQDEDEFGNKKKDKGGQTDGRRTSGTKIEKQAAFITVQADHDFYLSIDDKKTGDKILKNSPKKQRLLLGVHKLSFEEADSTGETVQRFIRITPDMLKRSDSVCAVAFKDDYLDIVQAYPPGAGQSTHRGTPVNEEEAGMKSVADELAADMIVKEGGSFLTGVRGGPKEAAPQKLSVRPMKVGRHEVTQRQWQAVMGVNNSITKNCPDCPVENLSWNEAVSFVEKLNKAAGKKFRLPTETEWEYLADKGIKEEIGGSSVDPEVTNQLVKKVIDSSAWYNEKSTHSVGKKSAVGGVYDLFGNVAEWCADDNPGEPAGNKKIFKGGSYKDKKEDLRLSARGTANAADRQRTVGLRLAADAE